MVLLPMWLILARAIPFVLLAVTVAAQAPPAATPPMALPEPVPQLSKEHFRERRQALVKAVGDGVILVRGATRPTGMGPFVQAQDFLYLTGISEPDLALVLVLGKDDGAGACDELLVPPFSRLTAQWEGDYLAPGEKSAERTGFATVGNVRNLKARLEELLAPDAGGARPLLHTLTSPAAMIGGTPGQAGGAASSQAQDAFDGRTSREGALKANVEAMFPGVVVKDLTPVIARLRMHKTKGEIEVLRASARAAADGIAEAMRSAAPGRYEFQLAAVARYVFSLRGAGPDAYGAIVGAAGNGCILHYMANSRRLEDGDLIVMDYAPTMHGYASDVTRTFPANGRFTDEQRKLVQDVYDIQQELLADVKPGASLNAIGRKCAQLLQQKGYASHHGPCHHVGLAVHDPSTDRLEPGMVITVEPGAYLKNQGMGCRIEDTVLVTQGGHENLSGHLPAKPDDVEKWMSQRGVIGQPVGLPR